ncbi:Homeodomain-like protein, partial [Chytriomyces sp. MP71]
TKPMRFRPTDGEYALLTGIFNKNQFPSRTLREKLAAHLGLNMRQVQLWFQNRR